MKVHRRIAIGAGLIATGLACSSDNGGTNPNPTVASVAVDDGNAQIGPAGQALANQLSVIVRDASSDPVAGVTVMWVAASGGGSVSPNMSSTNAGGIATTTRTLGATAGTHTTTATVAGHTPVTFNSVAQVQGATTISSRFQSQLSDTVLGTTVGQPLIAVVRNQSGEPVPGVVVNWTASGGGTVSQAVDVTDAGGESQVDYTFGATAGVYGAQAAVIGLMGSPVNYTLTANPGNPTALLRTGGDNLTVAPGGQVIHTVTTRDAHSNPTSGVAIDWAVATGGGTISPGSNFTGANGSASATRTLGAGLGDQTATATAAGLAGSPAIFTTTAANVANVTVGGALNQFNPSSVSVAVNGTVTWTWAAGNSVQHNVTFDAVAGAPANITDRSAGGDSRIFTTAGIFDYQCTIHFGMNGQVTVTP
jgi:plastocyanin